MNQTAFQQFTEAWNRQDIDGVVAHFNVGGSYHAAMGPEALGATFTGHAAIRTALVAGFQAFPDGRVVGTRPPVLGEHGGHAEWYFEFTAADGSKAQLHGCDIFEFENGKINSKNVYVKQFVPAA
jgi:ketosteroid isomerase-like protein